MNAPTIDDRLRNRPRPSAESIQPADPHFRKNIPLDVMPGMLGDDNGTVAWRKAFDALTQFQDVHQKLIDAALKVRNKAELVKHVEPLALKAMKTLNREIEGLTAQLKHHDTEIAASLGQGVGQIPQEIRAHVKSLPENKRAEFVRGLMAAEDVDSLKAIAAVAPFLSGLNAEVFDMAREAAERLANPKSVAERTTGTAALARMQRAYSDFDETFAAAIQRWRASDDSVMENLVKSLTAKKEGDDNA